MLSSVGLLTSTLVAGALVAGGIIGHSIPSSSTHAITACVKSNGTVRVIDFQAGKRCVKGEKAVSWNQAGPRGATGLQGVSGQTGLQGTTGIQGPAGPPGSTGPAGADGSQGPQGAPGQDGATGANGAQGSPGPKGDTGPSDAYATSVFGKSFSASSAKQDVLTLSSLPAGSYVINADITALNGVGGQFFGCGMNSPTVGDFSNLSFSAAEPSGNYLTVHVSGVLTTDATSVTVGCYLNGPLTMQWQVTADVNAIKVGTIHNS